nr:unnamed protein product [Callosobruchus analis]
MAACAKVTGPEHFWYRRQNENYSVMYNLKTHSGQVSNVFVMRSYNIEVDGELKVLLITTVFLAFAGEI